MACDLSSYRVAAGETSSATKQNNLIQAIQDALNAIGDTTKMAWGSGAIIDPNQIKQSGATSGQALEWNGSAWAPATVSGGGGTTIPAGMIAPYAVTSAPSGWLLCDGAAVSRTTYSTLFAAISTTYGTGDGSTTFNVPDLRGRMIAGYAASGGHTDVATIGNNDGVAAASRRPKHKTSITESAHSHSPISGSSYYERVGSGGTESIPHGSGNDAVLKSTTGTATTGITAGVSGTAVTDAPAYIVLAYVIKT